MRFGQNLAYDILPAKHGGGKMLTKMATGRIHQKVWSGGLAGAFTIIVVWVLHSFAGLKIPAEISSAITTVFTIVISWAVPPSAQDKITTT